ncbi:hypothetical protein [Blastococcus haudaquaticus]|uniref:Uncharacterized protein n=1 Tax=Blastococcus haudaquaticus TaxID=1938745 RepID=A0A286GSQ0_9ACTN|nr:hypothetical protein [Blastococcus haudaquaticus]SOD98558.1 hypothetical protein SAMN06272739_1954 [Blastococcus haudaquaticus]
MTVAVLVLLALVAAGGLVLTARGERVRPPWAAVLLTGLLGAAAVVAWAADDAADGLVHGSAVAAVLAAVLGGGPVATAVLRAADPAAVGVAGGPQDPAILRGGAWIGALERAAIAGALLVGSPEALAIIIAVKGLGRFAELRAPAAAERFIVGTLASGLWAAACVGVAMLLRG